MSEHWFQHLSVKVVRKLPPVFIRETERIGLSAGFIVIGVTSLMALHDQGPLDGVPLWAFIEWSLTLILGGLFTLWGMFTSQRLVERLGLGLSAVGTFTYGCAAITTGYPRATIIGFFFLFLTVVKVTRLMVSSAANVSTNGD